MLPGLKLSHDCHHLETLDGFPFFYLGDTAWELFHRLDRAEVEDYLEDRAAKGFNAVQAVVLAEADGLRTPNAFGELPLHDLDPERPNEVYFDHVDWVVDRAASLGLYTTMLPTWGDKWYLQGGSGPEVFTSVNAALFGEWLGRRYRDRPVIWMLGGDRSPGCGEHYAIIRAMARGLRQGDGGRHLVTYHTAGDAGSAEYFNDPLLLDFNTRQNGHEMGFERYARTRVDFERIPPKPVIDIEPTYEDIPISLKTESPVYSTADDVRRAFYWDVFGGACGHSYGHHSIWQFFDHGREPKIAPLMTWREGLGRPGAAQMGVGRRLMESRPAAGRLPEISMVADTSDELRGDNCFQIVATRGAGGAYAMVYVPDGRSFEVRMDQISGEVSNAWWFDPRTGRSEFIGQFPTSSRRTFIPPTVGAGHDWVLVLDDSTFNYAPPGVRAAST